MRGPGPGVINDQSAGRRRPWQEVESCGADVFQAASAFVASMPEGKPPLAVLVRFLSDKVPDSGSGRPAES